MLFPPENADHSIRPAFEHADDISRNATIPIVQVLAAIRQWAYATLRYTTVTNTATQWTIRLNRRGIDHTLRHVSDTEMGRHHARSLLHLVRLLTSASYSRGLPNLDPKQQRSLRAVHHFEHPLMLDAQTYRVRLIIKEAPDGYFFYDHRLLDKEPGVSAVMPCPHSQEGGDDRDAPGSR